MGGMPWVKVYTEMLDDVKLSRLTDAQKWRFVQLILLGGECDAGGALVTGESRVTLNDVTWRLRCDEITLSQDIEEFKKLGLITVEKGVFVISKFQERQGPSQSEKREQWRKRQDARRKRAIKPDVGDVTRDSPESHDIDEEKSREEEEEETVDAGDTKFSALSALIATKLKCNEHAGGPAKWIKAINQLVVIDPQECDVDAALTWMFDNQRPVAGPWSIVNPIAIEKNKRLHVNGSNGSRPKRDY